MATLRTDYADDVLDTQLNLRRKYEIQDNGDGTVSFEDATEYTQHGDVISAEDLNAINRQINTNTNNINTNATNISNNADAIDEINNTELPLKINKPASGNGTSGQVLKTNGDGTTYWDNAGGGGDTSEGGLEPSNTTTFGNNTITQTFATSGNTLVTTFNANGTITEVYTNVDAGTVTTSTTTFNNDGSVSVVTNTV